MLRLSSGRCDDSILEPRVADRKRLLQQIHPRVHEFSTSTDGGGENSNKVTFSWLA